LNHRGPALSFAGCACIDFASLRGRVYCPFTGFSAIFFRVTPHPSKAALAHALLLREWPELFHHHLIASLLPHPFFAYLRHYFLIPGNLTAHDFFFFFFFSFFFFFCFSFSFQVNQFPGNPISDRMCYLKLPFSSLKVSISVYGGSKLTRNPFYFFFFDSF